MGERSKREVDYLIKTIETPEYSDYLAQPGIFLLLPINQDC